MGVGALDDVVLMASVMPEVAVLALPEVAEDTRHGNRKWHVAREASFGGLPGAP